MEDYTTFIKEETQDISPETWSMLDARLAELQDNTELNDSITKRLLSKASPSLKRKIQYVVYLAIASRGYGLNHDSVRSLKVGTFVEIWEFLDTIKVSSSPSLSAVLVELLEGRSKDGYLYTTNFRENHARTTHLRDPSLDNIEWTQLTPDTNKDFVTVNHLLLVDKLAILRRGVRISDIENIF
jgi:hypothetical protein